MFVAVKVDFVEWENNGGCASSRWIRVKSIIYQMLVICCPIYIYILFAFILIVDLGQAALRTYIYIIPIFPALVCDYFPVGNSWNVQVLFQWLSKLRCSVGNRKKWKYVLRYAIHRKKGKEGIVVLDADAIECIQVVLSEQPYMKSRISCSSRLYIRMWNASFTPADNAAPSNAILWLFPLFDCEIFARLLPDTHSTRRRPLFAIDGMWWNQHF